MDSNLQAIIDKNLEKAVDYSQESGQCLPYLETIAQRDKCVLMAFVAPYAAVRVSPIETRGATIGLSEEFAVIGALDKLRSNTSKTRGIEKLYILINSPGGFVPSSYKIAKLLRASFKHIKVFIPHMAASGGTLMALAGNEIVMGRMSHLMPIDVQVPYGEQYVSAYCMSRALSRLSEFFSKTTSEEAPYPWKAMTEKLDPILLEHWSSNLTEIATYARELLRLSEYDTDAIERVVDALVFPTRSHTFVVDRDRARKLKLKLSTSTQDAEDLKVMEAWLTDYMLRAADKHIIRFVLPKNHGGASASANEESSKAKKSATSKV